MNSIKDIQKIVKDACFQYPDIMAVYLFGSVVNKEKKFNDVDVASLLDTSIDFSFSVSALLFSYPV